MGNLEQGADAAAEEGAIPAAGDAPSRRDQLLAAIAMISGLGLLLALPFALRAGAEFFLPLTIAVVLSIALVPLLEWLEKRGVGPMAAALICLAGFLALANGALALVVVPATTWFVDLPARIPKVMANLKPIIDLYSDVQRFVDDTARLIMTGPMADAQRVVAEPPGSLVDLFVSAAPAAALQMAFVLLLMFFLLSGWTRLRTAAITGRSSFGAAMATARVIQNVVSATSAYLVTITVINLLLGLSVALVLWLIGMDSPAMWGGIVALLNFIPYLGPVLAAVLLALGGLMTFDDLLTASLPALVQIVFHTVEANLITPLILGRRLTLNPLLILVALSFWGWVWGTPGALLAVPLLIIVQTVIAASGKPDIAGLLFEPGTLAVPRDQSPAARNGPVPEHAN